MPYQECIPRPRGSVDRQLFGSDTDLTIRYVLIEFDCRATYFTFLCPDRTNRTEATPRTNGGHPNTKFIDLIHLLVFRSFEVAEPPGFAI